MFSIFHLLSDNDIYLFVNPAAVGWEDKKVVKYSNLSENYHFVPVGIETYGANGPQGIKLVKQIGKKIQDTTSEKMSTFFLFQSISMAIQQGNAACVMGCRWQKPLNISLNIWNKKTNLFLDNVMGKRPLCSGANSISGGTFSEKAFLAGTQYFRSEKKKLEIINIKWQLDYISTFMGTKWH